MSQEFVKEMRANYKTDGFDLKIIWSLAEQRAFVRNLNYSRTSNVSVRMYDEKKNRDFGIWCMLE